MIWKSRAVCVPSSVTPVAVQMSPCVSKAATGAVSSLRKSPSPLASSLPSPNREEVPSDSLGVTRWEGRSLSSLQHRKVVPPSPQAETLCCRRPHSLTKLMFLRSLYAPCSVHSDYSCPPARLERDLHEMPTLLLLCPQTPGSCIGHCVYEQHYRVSIEEPTLHLH